MELIKMSPKKFSRVFSNDSLSPPQIIFTNLFEEITQSNPIEPFEKKKRSNRQNPPHGIFPA
jgi:hypothetical protein